MAGEWFPVFRPVSIRMVPAFGPLGPKALQTKGDLRLLPAVDVEDAFERLTPSRLEVCADRIGDR